ncbi:ATP-dependent RNA helicase HrpA [Demequina sp. TTPB684]|uniref:ATP-dependent RNA helicase HrpA n=1 Tax=unclassified Demequina TaxID=2620311 RepID=UPI001CF58068|nr:MULTISPECIES: ATP-dependent RNA helicase HrpA [unclassified Demequina]MCB2412127.1 ATP-dependent RNA helicase HrpA [Demequina sp. TTPB684]UPU89553.1 ATP-dependent RNA helicase HrpA [Demequina sp. TMPB413]
MASSRRADNRAPARAQVGATSAKSSASRAKAAAARAAVEVPPIIYPEELPVSARRDDIAAALRDHQVVIVAGETGSGKTTQIPKIALDLGRGRAGQIGHTQPRRIAARSVADRIAEELGTTLGDIIGYQVRFTDTSSERTLVKVMTDGILLAQIQRDPDLLAYDTLIIDEAHERSLNIDVLLGYLTNLLPRRPDLKLIITSATIDSERFARHFAPGGPIPDDAGVGDDAGARGADAVTSADLADARPTAPVIQVTGRTYPVEMRYRPLAGETRGEERDLMTGITDACDELMREGPGDILVFLSGEREIRDAVEALEGHLGPRVRDAKHPQALELLPLYSRLSAAEQHRVFASHSRRRIVLATNVAETSLTVPGIHYVVDPGTARISRYSKATKVQRLPIEPISKASANQRAGRAGRLADGIAIRLYSEDDFAARPDFTEPEILRTSLASVLLQMISVGVVSTPDEVAAFPFVEPPDTRAIKDGIQLLSDLGAVTTNRGGKARLTDVGRKLARLPIDPRQARMIVEGERHGVAYEAAVIAAALSIQDPRERPSDKRAEADLQHRRFSTPTSDLLGYLNLWAYLRDRQHELSGSAFRRMCRSEFLNYLRVREWQDLVQQLRQAAKPLGIHVKARAAKPIAADDAEGAKGTTDTAGTAAFLHAWDEDAIHRSVLAGLLTQIGMQDEGKVTASTFSHLRGEAKAIAMKRARKRATNEYLGTRGARFAIQPSSPLSKKPPAFVMAAELVETNRLWARDVARIDPAWAEELAGDLAKHTYSEPHWSTKRGAAMAHEKVLLYGVPIVAERRILWGKVNPHEARELFIRHALVQGEWTTHHEFWHANQSALADAAEVEARTRTFGLVAGEDELFDFYDERIPDHVVSAAHFDKWWKGAQRTMPNLLTYTSELLMPDAADVDPARFPDAWPQGELTLPLTYQFEPGADADGVTVHIPLAVLPRVTPDGFDWLVPGMLAELTTATIRALPKPVRRLLVPAPDVARDVVTWLEAHTPAWEDLARAGDMAESYRDAFTKATRALRDVTIPADAWQEVDERLPSHLKMTFRIVEYAGGRERVVDESAHLLALKRSLAPQTADAVRKAVGASSDTRQGAKVAAAAKPTPASFAGGPVAEKGDLQTWPAGLPAGALPDVIESDVGGGVVVRGYPGIVAEKGGAALRIAPDARTRDAAHPDGIRRLLLNECALPAKRVTSRWTSAESLALAASGYRNTDALVADLQWAAVTALTSPGTDDAAAGVRSADAYAAVRERVRMALEDEIHRLVALVVPIAEASRTLDAKIRSTTSMALLSTLAEVRALAADLAGDGFVSRTPPDRLRHLPRYLKAASHRIDKAQSNPARDNELAWKVREMVEELDRARDAATAAGLDAARDARIEKARWMIEEFRVSLFAQQLGTDGPVSEKRIRAALATAP